MNAPGPHAAAHDPSAVRRLGPGVALAFGAALVALAVNLVVPPLSALLVAILLGVLLANTSGVPAVATDGMAVAAKRLLRIGVVLLGLQLSLRDIAGLGAGTVLVVVAVVAIGILGTDAIGKAMGVKPAQRLLIACGFSICGAAAVAAVEGDIDDKDVEDVATAIALVVLFGTLMIAVVPLLSGAMGLPERTAGLWAGSATHEVAQVVAAAGIIGPAALKVAVIVKLARVLMLAPVIAAINLVRRRHRKAAHRSGPRPPIVPLFVAGFLAMVVLRTTGILHPAVLDPIKMLATVLLSAAMFALGTGVKAAQLRAVGGKPVLLGIASTVLIALVGLGGVLLAA